MGASWSAPIRNFFNRGKVKEEVHQGVEVCVNAAQKGLETLDDVTSGAVTSIADELSKAGVDLGQFKNKLVDGLEKDGQALADDVYGIEDEVTNAGSKALGTVENLGHGLKDELNQVETQAEAKVENAEEVAKAALTKTTASAENAWKITEDSVTETVSSLTSSLFGASSDTPKEQTPAKKEETPSLLTQGLSNGIQKVEETASVIEKKVEDTLPGWTTSLLSKEKDLVSGLTGLTDNAKESLSNKKEEISSDLSSGIQEVKDNVQTKKEEVTSVISAGIRQGEELASAGVEKATQGLSSLQESLSAKKDEIVSEIQQAKDVATAGVEKAAQNVDNLRKEASAKKKEVSSGLSSDLHFLRDTVVASKDVVVEAFHLGRQQKDDGEEKESSKTSAPEFQSTQKPIANSSDSEKEKSANNTEEQNSHENSTSSVKAPLEEEMGDHKEKSETSPAKEVGDFLKREISDASKHIEAKKNDVKQGASDVASASVGEAQAAQHSIFDSFTDISSTITNTLHNIETDIEQTGRNVMTGVGNSVKEAGNFIAGTEQEVDDKMNDTELKSEAVTSLLDKSLF